MSEQTPIYGLVLAGGKSTRMGRDKGLIDWHGKPQRYFLADLLVEFCEQVFISCRDDQASQISDDGYQPLTDCVEPTGQFGAILSALTKHPDAAFLVVACDLPLIDEDTISQLLSQRDNTKIATAFKDSGNLPEPLIAIWEPSAKIVLEEKYSSGIDCPRKTLINSHQRVKLIKPDDYQTIMNVNTPESAKIVRQVLADDQ